ERIRKRLEQGGVPAASIFSLGMVIPGCALEDLVRPDLFATAVNDELTTWAIGPLRIEADEVPALGRWRWLETEGIRTNTPIASLSKVRVAQRIVDLGRSIEAAASTSTRLDVAQRDGLKALHESLVAALHL